MTWYTTLRALMSSRAPASLFTNRLSHSSSTLQDADLTRCLLMCTFLPNESYKETSKNPSHENVLRGVAVDLWRDALQFLSPLHQRMLCAVGPLASLPYAVYNTLLHDSVANRTNFSIQGDTPVNQWEGLSRAPLHVRKYQEGCTPLQRAAASRCMWHHMVDDAVAQCRNLAPCEGDNTELQRRAQIRTVFCGLRNCLETWSSWGGSSVFLLNIAEAFMDAVLRVPVHLFPYTGFSSLYGASQLIGSGSLASRIRFLHYAWSRDFKERSVGDKTIQAGATSEKNQDSNTAEVSEVIPLSQEEAFRRESAWKTLRFIAQHGLVDALNTRHPIELREARETILALRNASLPFPDDALPIKVPRTGRARCVLRGRGVKSWLVTDRRSIQVGSPMIYERVAAVSLEERALWFMRTERIHPRALLLRDQEVTFSLSWLTQWSFADSKGRSTSLKQDYLHTETVIPRRSSSRYDFPALPSPGEHSKLLMLYHPRWVRDEFTFGVPREFMWPQGAPSTLLRCLHSRLYRIFFLNPHSSPARPAVAHGTSPFAYVCVHLEVHDGDDPLQQSYVKVLNLWKKAGYVRDELTRYMALINPPIRKLIHPVTREKFYCELIQQHDGLSGYHEDDSSSISHAQRNKNGNRINPYGKISIPRENIVSVVYYKTPDDIPPTKFRERKSHIVEGGSSAKQDPTKCLFTAKIV